MIVNFTLVQFVPGGPVEQIIAQIEGQGDVFAGFAGAGDAGAGSEPAGGVFDDKYVGARGLPPEFIANLKRNSASTNRLLNGS